MNSASPGPDEDTVPDPDAAAAADTGFKEACETDPCVFKETCEFAFGLCFIRDLRLAWDLEKGRYD